MKKLFPVLFTVLLSAIAIYGKAQSEELFTYGSHVAYLDEFTRQFYKNNPPESVTKDTARYYLDLFINFKLKVQQAKDMGLDTAGSFVDEMRQYRKQLAAPYMVDTSATEQLINEAYEHMKEEVKASHIMVAIGYDALPKDTLIAYNKAVELKNKLKKESFDSVAYKYSEDQSAKINYGNLGYFTAFDMIYPFERAAFNTPVGQIYGPFRTQYGYHVIKVFDRRPTRSKVNVAHLMLKLSPGAADKEILTVKEKIDSIRAEINSGRITFEAAVKQYSEDPNSVDRGGEVGLLESTNRAFPEAFRDVAFSLKKDGDISQPVKTDFGWHIIKRLGTEQLKPKDSLYNEIKRKISNPRDERYGLTHQAVINRIKKEYNYTETAGALNDFIAKADSSVVTGNWADEHFTSFKGTMFTLGGKTYTQRDFSKFIEANQQPRTVSDKDMVIRELFKSFVDQSAWEYEEGQLERKFPKYRYLVQEYNDGILLFNLSEKKVWNKGMTDTTGLKEFYEANKQKYMWKERLEASIYECKTEEVCKKVKKWVKKGIADTTISRMAHEIHPLSLAIKKGKFQAEDHPVISRVKRKKGTYPVEIDGRHYLVVVKDVLPAMPKALSEVRGPITSEYQNMLDKQWIEELHKIYPVVVNQQTFDAFLQTLNK